MTYEELIASLEQERDDWKYIAADWGEAALSAIPRSSTPEGALVVRLAVLNTVSYGRRALALADEIEWLKNRSFAGIIQLRPNCTCGYKRLSSSMRVSIVHNHDCPLREAT